MTQPTIWQVQAAQLAMLNWQVDQQRQLAAWQANLHQALYETEQMAGRVSATLSQDLFSAATLSRSWMLRVAGLGPQSFSDFNAKRAWSSAFAVLDGAARAAANDQRLGAEVDAYLQLMESLASFRRRMGAEAEPYVARFRSSLLSTMRGKGMAIVAGFCSAAAVLLFALDRVAFAVVVLALGVALVVAALDANAKWRVAKKNLASAEAFAALYHQFQLDPLRGEWLRRMWAEHVLLFNAPVPQAPPSSGHAAASQVYVERKLVERQVVVVRCRFCSQLTPVDRPSCEHCGSPGFGSSQ
jgi:hypothetical protein